MALDDYSSLFKVVGCTNAVDARDNTGTTGTGVSMLLAERQQSPPITMPTSTTRIGMT